MDEGGGTEHLLGICICRHYDGGMSGRYWRIRGVVFKELFNSSCVSSRRKG